MCAFVPWETAGTIRFVLLAVSDIDTLLSFVYLKHCLSQEKETIWIPHSWSVYNPCKPSLWTQYPNREIYFLQWPSSSPFHQGATTTKSQGSKRSFLCRYYLAVTAENRCGNGLWDGTFTKNITMSLFLSCESVWTGTQPLYHPTQAPVYDTQLKEGAVRMRISWTC